MRLEGLKFTFNAKTRNGEAIDLNLEIGSLDLDPNEHSDELKMLEKLLPLFSSNMNKITSDMATAKRKE